MLTRFVSARSFISLAAIATVAGLGHAQSFTEGFEPGPATVGTAAVPTNWTSVNDSPSGPGLNPDWQVRNDGAVFAAFSGTTYAFANYNSVVGASDISNYLMSPLVALSNGDTISFYTRTVTAPAFPDRLELVYNTTGSTLPADFTNVLLTVNPTLTTTGYPSVWTQFTATITGLSGPTAGRFAFHYNPANGGPTGTNSDYVGIDEVVYTNVGGATLATNTSLGQGCYGHYSSVYEAFVDPANFDLANSSIQLINTGTGYVLTTGGGFNPVGSLGTPTALALTDDSSITTGSFGIEVGSNCWIALGTGNSTDYAPDVAAMLNNPATGFYCWTDLNPSEPGSGQVQYEENGPLVQITFDGVYSWGGTSAADENHVQFQIDTSSGNVTIAWGTVSANANGFLVGYSPGGANADPGNADLSPVAAGSVVLEVGPVDILPMALDATTRPALGTNWNLQTSNGALFDVIVVGLVDPNIADLSFIGMPGCGIRATLDLIFNSSTATVPVPNVPSLVGIPLYANGASLAPAVNALELITSNGVQGTIGDV
ncbi:MAG: choice-of-anchor J domain-containing protein [Planctomycetes bacterium]|nr:choice-of-anchor J domain-containing protein [Planctomycetota bacterium]